VIDMRIKMYGATHVGRVRSKNQDYLYFNEAQGLAIVADGIGGRPGGEVASSVAVEGIRKSFLECEALRSEEVMPFIVSSIDFANKEILRAGSNNSDIKGMGTTLNCLLFVGDSVYIAHIGDSRTYLLSRANYWQITIDHSIQVYVDRGWLPSQMLESGQAKPGALVRALGLSERCEADVYERKIVPGDIFLTCSDGLSGMVQDKDVYQILMKNINNLSAIPKKLVAAANQNGGKDNTTVVISMVLE